MRATVAYLDRADPIPRYEQTPSCSALYLVSEDKIVASHVSDGNGTIKLYINMDKALWVTVDTND